MNLTKHFTLEELIKSQTADRLGIDNTPSLEIQVNLERVALNILEPVFEHFQIKPVISSGYRCPALNQAIGSKDTSQHVTGEAVDFEVPKIDNYQLACWCRDNLDYDQIILEFYNGKPDSGWVHGSWRPITRRHALTINKNGTFQGIRQA